MSQPLCISPNILKLNCGAPFCTSGVCYLTYLDCTLTLDPYSLPGVHFKRWCVMQSKIRAGTLNEYTADVEMAVKLAKRLLTNSRVNLQKGDENP
jgi:hypothetical protein